MKQFFLISIFILLAKFSVSQNKFVIKTVGTKYLTEEINSAISAADWCGFYYTQARRELNFDDGSIVEFLSAEEIESLGIELNSTCYSNSEIKDDKIYFIHPTGRVLIRVEKNKSFKTTTIK
mgnify:CR=1 FL=1